MSSEPKAQDWTKPAAMAIPKGGCFPRQGRKGEIRPDLSEDTCVLRLFDPREDHPGPRGGLLRVRAEASRRPSLLSRMRSPY